MTRGKLAAGVAATGVALSALALVQAVVFAASGAYLLVVAPIVGLPIAVSVYRALRTVCTTGSARAGAAAGAGILLLAAIALAGISFGGLPLLFPAMFLGIAAALTPRPAPPPAGRSA